MGAEAIPLRPAGVAEKGLQALVQAEVKRALRRAFRRMLGSRGGIPLRASPAAAGGQDLNELLVLCGMGQADAAAASGISRSTVSELANGVSAHPRPRSVRKLAAGLNRPVAEVRAAVAETRRRKANG